MNQCYEVMSLAEFAKLSHPTMVGYNGIEPLASGLEPKMLAVTPISRWCSHWGLNPSCKVESLTCFHYTIGAWLSMRESNSQLCRDRTKCYHYTNRHFYGGFCDAQAGTSIIRHRLSPNPYFKRSFALSSRAYQSERAKTPIQNRRNIQTPESDYLRPSNVVRVRNFAAVSYPSDKARCASRDLTPRPLSDLRK